MEGAGYTGALLFKRKTWEVTWAMGRRGRPKKDKTFGRIVNVRLSDEDFERLLAVTNTDGDTYSDVIRKALKFYCFTKKKDS